MNRDEKQRAIDQLKAELAQCPNVFVLSFEKIPVREEWELRKQVRAAGGRYRVIKNTLASRSAEGTPVEPVLRSLAGPTALALTAASPVEMAKILSAYAKANPNFAFRAGVVEGRVVSLGEIAELALLPAKEELLAKVLTLIVAPARGLAGVLQSVVRNLASVIDQAVKENKFQP